MVFDLCIFLSWFRQDDFFHCRKHYYGLALLWLLWTCISARSNGFKNILIVDLFLTNTQFLSSQDVNWWTGVVWIIVMFLSAVWTLILTAPIHCRGSITEQVMECYNISPNVFQWKNNLIYIYRMNFYFGWTIPLTIYDPQTATIHHCNRE